MKLANDFPILEYETENYSAARSARDVNKLRERHRNCKASVGENVRGRRGLLPTISPGPAPSFPVIALVATGASSATARAQWR